MLSVRQSNSPSSAELVFPALPQQQEQDKQEVIAEFSLEKLDFVKPGSKLKVVKVPDQQYEQAKKYADIVNKARVEGEKKFAAIENYPEQEKKIREFQLIRLKEEFDKQGHEDASKAVADLLTIIKDSDLTQISPNSKQMSTADAASKLLATKYYLYGHYNYEPENPASIEQLITPIRAMGIVELAGDKNSRDKYTVCFVEKPKAEWSGLAPEGNAPLLNLSMIDKVRGAYNLVLMSALAANEVMHTHLYEKYKLSHSEDFSTWSQGEVSALSLGPGPEELDEKVREELGRVRLVQCTQVHELLSDVASLKVEPSSLESLIGGAMGFLVNRNAELSSDTLSYGEDQYDLKNRLYYQALRSVESLREADSKPALGFNKLCEQVLSSQEWVDYRESLQETDRLLKIEKIVVDFELYLEQQEKKKQNSSSPRYRSRIDDLIEARQQRNWDAIADIVAPDGTDEQREKAVDEVFADDYPRKIYERYDRNRERIANKFDASFEQIIGKLTDEEKQQIVKAIIHYGGKLLADIDRIHSRKQNK